MIGYFIKLSVKMFQPLIVIYRKGDFVYYHWGNTNTSIIRIVLSLYIPVYKKDNQWNKKDNQWNKKDNQWNKKYYLDPGSSKLSVTQHPWPELTC